MLGSSQITRAPHFAVEVPILYNSAIRTKLRPLQDERSVSSPGIVHFASPQLQSNRTRALNTFFSRLAKPSIEFFASSILKICLFISFNTWLCNWEINLLLSCARQRLNSEPSCVSRACMWLATVSGTSKSHFAILPLTQKATAK